MRREEKWGKGRRQRQSGRGEDVRPACARRAQRGCAAWAGRRRWAARGRVLQAGGGRALAATQSRPRARGACCARAAWLRIGAQRWRGRAGPAQLLLLLLAGPGACAASLADDGAGPGAGTPGRARGDSSADEAVPRHDSSHVPSPGSSTICATCPRRVRLAEDEGCGERRSGMGDGGGRGGGVGCAQAWDRLGGEWRLRWLSRGPTAEHKAHPAYRLEKIRRAVSASFHPLGGFTGGEIRGRGGRWSAKSHNFAGC